MLRTNLDALLTILKLLSNKINKDKVDIWDGNNKTKNLPTFFVIKKCIKIDFFYLQY